MLKQLTQKYLPALTGKYINLLSFIAPRYGGAKAVKLFCTPRIGRLRPKDEAILQSFQQEQLEYNGFRIQCYVKGNGAKTVMLVHGWESNAARWKRLFDLLENEDRYRVVAIDAPAHGGSGGSQFNSPLYAQFIKKACDHYHPDILIGHSIGAASIVFYLTHLQAQPAEKLVLMGSASDFTDISKVFTQFLGLNRRSVEAMNSHFRQLFQMEPDYYSISNFARKLEIKGLLVHDVQDPVCAFTNSERIAANWKDAVLVPVNGAGHSLNSTEALEKIMQFVTG